ncbi:MAG TPA: M23 family metallopeptidase, partial [Epsilonproteobacteria bacterium]|nr:M23 family metallopeptidase [Campylobacterota bacterium]
FDAKIVATDLAGNKRETHIPFYHGNPRYKVSKIRASDKFIDGKITDLASSDPEYAGIGDRLEKLKAINETMRLKNEALIHKLSRHVSDEMIDAWHIKRFYPLKNGKRVASFGDHRYYYYKDKNNIVSESYHVGYDLASTKMADVIASNPGKVVFADENGIYGNMPLIDHGLGLYTLYGHCSQLLVKEGDEVHAGQVIAKTGMTGLALGDHLHFGMLVQGIEVRPVEWFDRKWIKKFIDNVFKEADRIIAPKEKDTKQG